MSVGPVAVTIQRGESASQPRNGFDAGSSGHAHDSDMHLSTCPANALS